ncbi:MAG TPA: prepilin peptidase [Candidatus Andersenbacteria bacterium]|nr:prepilin peptidase [Candidatus Andersenbacteria bacterium]
MLTLFTGFLTIILFVLGSAIGSFLLVVADRYESEENPFMGRSRCDYCKKQLRWYELIPYGSFIWNRGRCSGCKKELSPQYPLFELASGLLCIGLLEQALISQHQLAHALCMYGIACILLILIRIDLVSMILPDRFIALLVIASCALAIITYSSFQDIIFGLLTGVGFLYGLWMITAGEGIGFGDVKLMIPFGILFGFQGIVTLLFISFFIGGIVGIWLISIKKAGRKTAVPFGPFLALAAFCILLIPDLPNRFFQLLGVE